MASKLIDISQTVSGESVVWPSAPPPRIERRLSLERGDAVNDSNLFMNVHTGTHIDAPNHHVAEGRGADEVDLDLMVGEAWVVDTGDERQITLETLARCWPDEAVKRVLFRTRNSRLPPSAEFRPDFCALAEGTSRWFIDREVMLVGVDYLSVQPFGDPPTLHRQLLRSNIVLLEGLNLSQASAGKYELLCLPLKLAGADGAPARAVLRRIS